MNKITPHIFSAIFIAGLSLVVRGGMKYYVGEFTSKDINLVIIGAIFTIVGLTYELKHKPASTKK